MSGPPEPLTPATTDTAAEKTSGKKVEARYRTYVSIKTAVTSMGPDELDRQLPNLVDTIASLSADHPETVRFQVGVSFTEDPKPFDYSIDHVIEPDEKDVMRTIPRKDALSENHLYISFSYPPDPDFSPEALRGALLSAIERQEFEKDPEPPSSESSIFSWLSRSIDS